MNKLWRRVLSNNIFFKDSDLIEKFVLGGGPGGQSVNKSRNKVQLTHLPTGIQVKCQDERYYRYQSRNNSENNRDLETNRKIARRRLHDKLDLLHNGEESRLSQRHAKIKRRKDRAARLSFCP